VCVRVKQTMFFLIILAAFDVVFALNKEKLQIPPYVRIPIFSLRNNQRPVNGMEGIGSDADADTEQEKQYEKKRKAGERVKEGWERRRKMRTEKKTKASPQEENTGAEAASAKNEEKGTRAKYEGEKEEQEKKRKNKRGEEGEEEKEERKGQESAAQVEASVVGAMFLAGVFSSGVVHYLKTHRGPSTEGSEESTNRAESAGFEDSDNRINIEEEERRGGGTTRGKNKKRPRDENQRRVSEDGRRKLLTRSSSSTTGSWASDREQVEFIDDEQAQTQNYPWWRRLTGAKTGGLPSTRQEEEKVSENISSWFPFFRTWNPFGSVPSAPTEQRRSSSTDSIQTARTRAAAGLNSSDTIALYSAALDEMQEMRQNDANEDVGNRTQRGKPSRNRSNRRHNRRRSLSPRPYIAPVQVITPSFYRQQYTSSRSSQQCATRNHQQHQQQKQQQHTHVDLEWERERRHNRQIRRLREMKERVRAMCCDTDEDEDEDSEEREEKISRIAEILSLEKRRPPSIHARAATAATASLSPDRDLPNKQKQEQQEEDSIFENVPRPTFSERRPNQHQQQQQESIFGDACSTSSERRQYQQQQQHISSIFGSPRQKSPDRRSNHQTSPKSSSILASCLDNEASNQSFDKSSLLDREKRVHA